MLLLLSKKATIVQSTVDSYPCVREIKKCRLIYSSRLDDDEDGDDAVLVLAATDNSDSASADSATAVATFYHSCYFRCVEL